MIISSVMETDDILSAMDRRDTSYLKYRLGEAEEAVDLEKVYPNGQTLLTLAAQRGFDDVVELLITQGAQIDKPNALGNTALAEACHYGHISACKVLLIMGSSINTANHKDETPLTKAIEGSHEIIFRELLANGVDFCRNNDIVNVRNPEFAAILINHTLHIKTELKKCIRKSMKEVIIEKEVFPMRCLSPNERSKFEINFKYEKPLCITGSIVLFVAETKFLIRMDQDPSGKTALEFNLNGNYVENAELNCTSLTPISEGLNAFDFYPKEGSNSLIFNRTYKPNSNVKLIVIAYVITDLQNEEIIIW